MTIVLLFTVLAEARLASAKGPKPDLTAVPEELEPWIEWVKPVEPRVGECRDVDGTTICIWPTHLRLELDADGGSFELQVVAHAAQTVGLPGGDEAWPQAVRVDGKPALVIDQGDGPVVRLEPGRQRIEGRFLWGALPDTLTVPTEVALIELVVSGTAIAFPIRSDDLLDLPQPDDTEPEPGPDPQTDDAEPEPNSERIEVSRLVEDGVPLQIFTWVDLRIAGQDRELELPYPLADNAKLLRIDSDLPIAFDEARNLVVKVRSGTYHIGLTAHLPEAPAQLGPPALPPPWPEEEVWIWRTQIADPDDDRPSLGHVAVTGGSPIDRTRTHAPTSWPEGATYAVTPDRPLRFELLERGVSETAPNALVLEREAIYDLHGDGWRFFDTIRGQLHGASRLDLSEGLLGNAFVDGRPQVITIGKTGQAGVELRNPNLEMTAEWRRAGPVRTLPLSGWSETFDRVSVAFRLPPGWDLLYVGGPGKTVATWLESWDAVSAVLLIGVCVAIGGWVDRRTAVAGVVGLALMFDAHDDAFGLLLTLIAVLVASKVAMDRSLRPWTAWGVRTIWALSAFLLVAWAASALPENLERVWQNGAPALGGFRFERAVEDLVGLGLLAVVLASITSGVAWLIVRSGGVAPKLRRVGLALLGAFVLGLLLLGLLSFRGGSMPSRSAPESTAASGADYASAMGHREVAQEGTAEAPPEEYDDAKPKRQSKPEPEIDGPMDADSWAVPESPMASPVEAEPPKPSMDGLAKGRGEGLGDRLDPSTQYVESGSLPDAPPPEIPQTGEAKPTWNGRVWTVALDRTAKDGEAITLWLLPPVVNQVIALVRALALAAMVLLLVGSSWDAFLHPPNPPIEPPIEPDENSLGEATGPGGLGLAVMLMVFGAPALARAAPPQELLQQLAERVNAEAELAPHPECGPDCALVSVLRIDVEARSLTLEAEVHMAGPGVYRLPGALETWGPSSVTVDGQAAEALTAREGQLLLRLSEGLHRVVMRGPIAGDELDLSLQEPKRVEVKASGWTVEGVDESNTAQSVHLQRDSNVGDVGDVVMPDERPKEADKASQDLPVWLAVDREFEIGPRWTLQTKVTRLNDGPSPVTIRVPLLEGEQMIQSSKKIEDPKATLTLEHAGEVVTWTSVLQTRAALVLAAPKGEWTERWVFVCDAAWQCEAEGIPPSYRKGARSVYHPWPGESLKVALFKPTPAEGSRLSVDDASLHVGLGEDGTTATLNLSLRTSTVGERTITIPEAADLRTVQVDGHEVPTNKASSAIRLTFQPGYHAVRIEWKQDDTFTTAYQTPAVSLGGPATNARVAVALTDDASLAFLWLGGDGNGPVVWLGAWVLAIAGLAGLLHVINPAKPAIRLHDWFLLGLGIPIVLFPIVVGWFLFIGHRRSIMQATHRDRMFNAVQLGAFMFTLAVGFVAIYTARSLLIDGMSTMPYNLHAGEMLSWVVDHTDDAMPRGQVFAVPDSLWRVLWFGWVAWFAWRSIAWVQWTRAELSDGGWLRFP